MLGALISLLIATPCLATPQHDPVVDRLAALSEDTAVAMEDVDTPTAERLSREHLALTVSRFGAESPEAAESLTSLAYVLRFRGANAEAETLLRRAVAIDQVHSRTAPDDAIQRLQALALTRAALGDLAGAQAILNQARALTESGVDDNGMNGPAPRPGLDNDGRRLGRDKESIAA